MKRREAVTQKSRYGYVLLASSCFLLLIPSGQRHVSGAAAQEQDHAGLHAFYEALAPYADACWNHGSWGRRGTSLHGKDGSAFPNAEAAVILLPTDRSFVACHPEASMGEFLSINTSRSDSLQSMLTLVVGR